MSSASSDQLSQRQAKKRSRKSYADGNSNAIHFCCKWWLCNETSFPDCDQLMVHVMSHIEPYEASGAVSCLWKDCDIPQERAMNFEEAMRHLSFHVYHANIMETGNRYLQSKTTACCTQLKAKIDTRQYDYTHPFTCLWINCGATTNVLSEYFRHVSAHADAFPSGNNGAKLIHCMWDNCSSRFNSKSHLREHMRVHTSEKVIACSYCGGTFANREKLLLHVERQQPSNGSENMCSFCYKTFPTKSLLLQHVYHHVNHYLCPFCGFTVRAPSDLKKHVYHKHQTEKPFICSEFDCTACFKSEFDLARHVSDVHKKEAKFECYVETCDFACIHFAKLVTHLKQEHGETNYPKPQYACHICSSRFKIASSFSKHLKSIHKIPYPTGTDRFRFVLDSDGCYRMQTERVNQLKDVFLCIEGLENEAEVNGDVDLSETVVIESSSDSCMPVGKEVCSLGVKCEAQFVVPDRDREFDPFVLFLPGTHANDEVVSFRQYDQETALPFNAL